LWHRLCALYLSALYGHIQADITQHLCDGVIVEVFNAIGQRVYRIEPTQYPIAIDTTPTRGVYLVRLTTADGTIHQSKLIVE
jgi:hypothetical protein